MTGHIFKTIREPDSLEDWFVLETDKGYYELRLGGLNKVKNKTANKVLSLPFSNIRIARVLTDNFAVAIELDNAQYIVHSDTFITSDGETSFEIKVVDKEIIENDDGLEGMIPIELRD